MSDTRVDPSPADTAKDTAPRPESDAADAGAAAAAAAAPSAVFAPRPRNEKAFEFLHSLGAPPHLVVAPMVDQSELPFRMMTRKYGATLAYSPMVHARIFAASSRQKRRRAFITSRDDRPLVVQFCANDPGDLLAAAKLVEHVCDAVDINLGCPQRIAKNGNYGAFLLEQPDVVRPLVEALSAGLKVPVFCKIRSLGDIPRTVEFARMLEDAGCQLITVHGRTKEMKGPREGLADWDLIKAIKDSVGVPVFANGNIRSMRDVVHCVRATGVDGVMSAIGLLRNPRLFDGGYDAAAKAEDERIASGAAADEDDGHHIIPPLTAIEMALEYLDYAAKYPPEPKMVKGHIFWLIREPLNDHPDLRHKIATSHTCEAHVDPIKELRDRIINGIEGPKEVTDDIRVDTKRDMRNERKRIALEAARSGIEGVKKAKDE